MAATLPTMAERLRSDRPSNTMPPGDVTARIDRALVRMRELAPQRNECWQFYRGNTYTYRTAENQIVQQATQPAANGGGKPAHRVRTSRAIHMPVIRQEVSYATQRVPGYEVSATNTDPEVQSAARTAGKVALYGYDKWRIKRATEKVVTHALVADAGYAWPYWDTSIGPFVANDPENGRALHQGEVRIRTFGSNQVGWEPGVDFEESRWHIVVQALPVEQVEAMPGYQPGKLVADATDRVVLGTGKPTRNNLVMVTEYLERPSAQHKQGRRLCIANQRQITPTTGYPLVDAQGTVLDEPVLHKLTVMIDPDSDQDMGLLRFLLDTVRTYQDVLNKCVAGETSVITRDGLRRADELDGTVDVLARDGKFRPATWSERGRALLWRVEFDDGTVTYATQNHRWIARKAAKDEWVTTPMLAGARVPVNTLKAHTPIEDRDAWWRGVQNGLMWGDGTVEHHRRGEREYAYGSIRQHQHSDNLALIERFFPDQHTDRREYAGRPWIQARGIDPALKSVPAPDAGFDYIRGFLAGALATDGHTTTRGSVHLSQKSREELEAVATLARSVGIAHGGVVKHTTRLGTWHALRFDSRSFVDEGGVDTNLILKPYCQDKLAQHARNRKWTRTPCRKVVSVWPTDRYETVYCCEEPETSTWTLGNSLVTGNSLEWKNQALVPQLVAPPGSILTPITDEPGAIITALRPELVKWRDVPTIPPQLFEIADRAKADLGFLASQNEIPSQVEAARAVQVLTERDNNARAAFIANLAEWHSRLMRHCLTLVARHYTEGRLIRINGWSGPEVIRDFKGADLMDQVDVLVLPGSIEPRTRQAIEQRVMTFAQLGWIAPHQAMAAIDGGTAEGLVRSYELDIARANRIIQQIFTDPESVLNGPMVPGPQAPDPTTGLPVSQDTPWWMPRPFDAIPIYKTQFENAMKTERYDQSPPEIQEMLQLVYAGLEQIEAQQQAQAIAAQNAMAQDAGMRNAAKPGDPKPMPSQPNLSGPGGQPGQPTDAPPKSPTGLAPLPD